MVVAGGQAVQGSRQRMTATEIMSVIETIVEHFFECIDCKEHFLQAYRSCRYDRCISQLAPPSTNYEALQLWLWRFHNAVNIRIREEYSDAEVMLWPQPQDHHCPSCWLSLEPQPATFSFFRSSASSSSQQRNRYVVDHEAVNYNASEVTRFLRRCYWL
jgi:hypothetical protein